MTKKAFIVFLLANFILQPVLSNAEPTKSQSVPAAKDPLDVLNPGPFEVVSDSDVNQEDLAEEQAADRNRALIEGLSEFHASKTHDLVQLYARALSYASNLKQNYGDSYFRQLVQREEVVIYQSHPDGSTAYAAEVKFVKIRGRELEFVRVVDVVSGYSYFLLDRSFLPDEFKTLSPDEIPKAIEQLVETEKSLIKMRAQQHIKANHRGRHWVVALMDGWEIVGGKEYLKPKKLSVQHWKEYGRAFVEPITTSDVTMAAFFALVNGSAHIGLNYIQHITQNVPMDLSSAQWSFIFPMVIGTILGTYLNWTLFPKDDVYPNKKRTRTSFMEWLKSKKPAVIRDLKKAPNALGFAALVTTYALREKSPAFLTLTFWEKFETVSGIVIPSFIVKRSLSRAWDSINIIRKESNENAGNVKIRLLGREYDTGWDRIKWQNQITNLAPIPFMLTDYSGFTSLEVYPFHLLHYVGFAHLPAYMEALSIGLPMGQLMTFPLAIYGALRIIDKIVERKLRDKNVPLQTVVKLENTVEFAFHRWLGILAITPITLYGSILWTRHRILPKKEADPNTLPHTLRLWKHRLRQMEMRWKEGYGIPPLRWARLLVRKVRSYFSETPEVPQYHFELRPEIDPRDPDRGSGDCESRLSA